MEENNAQTYQQVRSTLSSKLVAIQTGVEGLTHLILKNGAPIKIEVVFPGVNNK